jgi:hypothetical protein
VWNVAAKTWNDAKAQALKILGDKAKIPEPKANLSKLMGDVEKADKEYDASVDVLQAKILALQNTNDAWKNAAKQFDDQVSKNDFGLDAKDADDKKKIQQAQDILSAYLDEQIDTANLNDKNLDELDKHSMAISKYETKT